MNQLLPHQVKYAEGYKDKELVVHEGGTGKTICAAVWLKDGRDMDALVVCPKRVKRKWQNTLTLWGTKATVLTIEEFKKEPHHDWSARVIDEADEFASPLFLKGRSARATKLYALTKAYPDTPTLLLTATPIRSKPWNIHTLLCYLGVYIPWKEFRADFFTLKSRPFLTYPGWFPKQDWRIRTRTLMENHADVVLLKDCVDYLPPVQEDTITMKTRVFKVAESELFTPATRFIAEHRYEQELKAKEILTIGREYRKVLVVAYYVEQVEELQRQLSKDRQVFMVHGAVKDQETILQQAQESDECFLIVQASLGAGFDADTFSCVVFASMSYKVRDFVQMKYRVRRIHNLHPVRYVFLIGGKADKQVFDRVQLGKDFVPSEYAS